VTTNGNPFFAKARTLTNDVKKDRSTDSWAPMGVRVSGLASMLMAGLIAVGCGASDHEPPRAVEAHRVDESRLAMGSSLNLSAWTADEAAAHAAFEAVSQEFDRLDRLMSVWKEGSDVLRVNAAAGDHPVRVSAEVIELLKTALDISAATRGTFDVTFGALTDVWKFDQDQDGSIPSPEQIRQRLPLVGYRDVVVDAQASTVFLRRKGMRLHLGGIGKGYAVDRAVAILRQGGFRDFLIQAGGDLYAGGRRGDRAWKLGIADPRNPDGPPFATVELADRTFSTSGDYERFFIKDGVRYHHILDLRTGQPARLCRSVTLVTDRAVVADALAKGVFILGPKEGMALIEQTPGVQGVIVSSTNEVLISKGLMDRVTLVHPPTDAP
jgi:thiamine biosynthesis lipoprotein